MSKIVVTYFEPFGGRNTNASKEVVSLLDGFEKVELPVSWDKVPLFIDKILFDKPDYLFMVGEAGSYKNITIEKVAHNIANGKDNLDVLIKNRPISKDGKDILLTPFELFDLPYQVSDDAGKFLCNYSYYLALSKADNCKVLFIHLPYIGEENGNSLDNLKKDLLNIINSLSE